MFYHISAKKDLQELQPRVSTHGKSWVYALKDPTIGLAFAGRDYLGNKADDGYTKYGITAEGIPEIFELYEGCFEEIFKGKDCHIYELEDSGFFANQTSWQVEYVSPNTTKITNSTYVPDIWSEINNLANQGKFVLHYYQNTREYNKFVRERIESQLSYDTSGWIRVPLIKHYESIVRDYVSKNIQEGYSKEYENLTPDQLKEVFNELDNDEYSGMFVRKELLYLYPTETIEWINGKYEKAKQNAQNKQLYK